jgi:hypothetical protein
LHERTPGRLEPIIAHRTGHRDILHPILWQLCSVERFKCDVIRRIDGKQLKDIWQFVGVDLEMDQDFE